MATVTLFNAARSQAIEDNAIVSGLVDVNGKLILTKHNGQTVDAGNVKGPKGDDGSYPFPSSTAEAGTSWIRIATLDSGTATLGASYTALISGLGTRTTTAPPRRTTLLVQAAARGDNNIKLEAWAWDPVAAIKLYTNQLTPTLFELWIAVPAYTNSPRLTELHSWNATRNIDGATSTIPVGLVEISITQADPNFATSAETIAGVLDAKTVTPAGLSAAIKPMFDKVNKAFNFAGFERETPAEALNLHSLLNSPMFRDYKETTGLLVDEAFGQPRAFKTSNGWISMRGLIKNTSATVAGALLFTLPVGWRPPKTIMFNSAAFDSGGGMQAILVDANGDVTMVGATLAGTWHSLGDIFFNVNSYNQALTLTSPFTAIGTSTYGPPSLYKSPDGLAHAIGAVGGGTAGNTAFALPAGYTSPIANTEYHYNAATSGGFAYSNYATGSNAYRPRTSASQHLSGFRWITGSTLKNYQATLLNGWTNYGGAFPVAQAMKTSDGMVMLTGLVKAGTFNQTMFTLPVGWRPKRTIIVAAVSNDQYGAVYIQQDGAVSASQGAAGGWFSIDGITFAAEW